MSSLKPWIDALKSNKYKHCKGFLGSYETGELCHCAVGVLCELETESGLLKTEVGDYVDKFKIKRYDSFICMPAPALREKYPQVVFGIVTNLSDETGDYSAAIRYLEELENLHPVIT